MLDRANRLEGCLALSKQTTPTNNKMDALTRGIIRISALELMRKIIDMRIVARGQAIQEYTHIDMSRIPCISNEDIPHLQKYITRTHNGLTVSRENILEVIDTFMPPGEMACMKYMYLSNVYYQLSDDDIIDMYVTANIGAVYEELENTFGYLPSDPIEPNGDFEVLVYERGVSDYVRHLCPDLDELKNRFYQKVCNRQHLQESIQWVYDNERAIEEGEIILF